MFDWFLRNRVRRVQRRDHRFRPGVEWLEAREVPAAPQLTLAISYGAQVTVTLSGQVFDERPEATQVVFNGVVTGSVTPNAEGYFSYTTQATGLGPVGAQALDDESLASEVAQVYVQSAPPQIIEFRAFHAYDQPSLWEFYGRVADESPAGLIVYFGGLPSLVGKTAVVWSDGWFSLRVTLAPGEQGVVTARVCDWWGQMSNIAQVLAAN